MLAGGGGVFLDVVAPLDHSQYREPLQGVLGPDALDFSLVSQSVRDTFKLDSTRPQSYVVFAR